MSRSSPISPETNEQGDTEHPEPRVGARLSCRTCGTQVVVVKPPAELSCCGEPMVAPE